MMVWVVAILALVLLFWWLTRKVVVEQDFKINTTVMRKVVFNYLKSPDNLVKSHPNILQIADLEETEETSSFHIEENVGPLGRKQFLMVLVAYENASQPMSHISFECNTGISDVLVTVGISDADTSPGSKDTTPAGDAGSTTTLRAVVKVTALRILASLIVRNLAGVWAITLRKMCEALQQAQDAN